MAGNLGSQLPDGGDRDSKKQIKAVRRKGRLLEGTGRESFRVGLRGTLQPPSAWAHTDTGVGMTLGV